MKRQTGILAGTALGLLMAAAPVHAAQSLHSGLKEANSSVQAGYLLLAQADDGNGEEVLPRDSAPAAEQPAEQIAPEPEAEQPRKRKDRQEQAQQPAEPEPAAPQVVPEAVPAPEAAREAIPAAPEAEQPRKRKERQEQGSEKPRRQAEPEQAQQPAEPEPAPQVIPEAAPTPDAAPEIAPAAPEAEQPRKRKERQDQSSEKPRRQAEPEQAQQPVEAPAPLPEVAPEPSQEPAPEVAPVPEARQNQPAEAAPAASEKQPEAESARDAERNKRREERIQRQKDRNKQNGEAAPATPVEAGAPEAIQPPPPRAEPVDLSKALGKDNAAAPENENAAPVLDSDKDAVRNGGKRPSHQPEAKAEPAPRTDAAAQSQMEHPVRVAPIAAEEGRRIRGDRERGPQRDFRNERPSGVDVLKEIGDRVILELGGRQIVESSDRGRLSRNSSDVYYEELPRGRTRETIERADGSRVVTIRNRNGDIVQRSRIDRNNREYILSYVDERDYGRLQEWRDPGDDLPPLRLNIPAREYILDAGRVEDPDLYYDFLDQPPVEPVRRLYSVDEVKRSARVRDTVRRVDMDTLTFDTGSATLAPAQIKKLEDVADAMHRLLDRNPAETFLIEGHTDAIGSNQSNLALSDRRAEGVADVLSDYFDIPPENLVTQGYGEEYLKIKTDLAERANRRVAIRRITPLVAPVASAKR